MVRQVYAQKLEFQVATDTQALTYALGLATPETNYLSRSPQPTLYPEDSMSVADTRTQTKRNPSVQRPSVSVPDTPIIIPTDKRPQDSGLMNMDFRVRQMSLSELTMEDGGLSPTETAEHDLAKGRYISGAQLFLSGSPPHSASIPPRVPSPPPLPSLSQLALAQHNPEADASHCSPTYSLYGLYESSDRRGTRR